MDYCGHSSCTWRSHEYGETCKIVNYIIKRLYTALKWNCEHWGTSLLFESDNYQFLDSLLQPVSKALQIALKNCIAKVFFSRATPIRYNAPTRYDSICCYWARKMENIQGEGHISVGVYACTQGRTNNARIFKYQALQFKEMKVFFQDDYFESSPILPDTCPWILMNG